MDRRSVLKAAAAVPVTALAGVGLSSRVAASVARSPYSIAAGAVIEAREIGGVSLSWLGERGSTGAIVQTLINGEWGKPTPMVGDHGHGPEDPNGRIHGPLLIDEDAEAHRIVSVTGGDLTAHELPKSLRIGPMANATTVIEPIPGLEIQPRSSWTTRERKDTIDCTLRSSVLGLGCRSDVALRHVMVHHTVNSNSYGESSVPALLRGIQNYHMDTQGWDDIGYNFVVDRFGRIWHGRSGDALEPITGGHTSGFNAESVGIAVLGDFTSSTPPNSVVRAVGALAGWKCRLHGIDPNGITFVRDSATGDIEQIRTVSGHRDLGQTSCPGSRLYSEMSEIRSRAAEEVTMYGFAEPAYTLEKIDFTGWAIDPADQSRHVDVEFTIDGQTSTIVADASYSGLGNRYPDAGSDHGFDVTVPIDIDTRSVTVDATGADGFRASLADLTLFAGFIDVEPDKFFARGVYFMRQHEITSGTGPGLFEPMDSVKRSQAATFLWRYMDKPEASTVVQFEDIEPGSFEERPVSWMIEAGITEGTTETTFSPKEFVTRAQMVTFLWRLCGEIKPAGRPPFSDVPNNEYYSDAVAWIAEIGASYGVADTGDEFAPNRELTRGELATLLYRLSLAPDAWVKTPPPPSADQLEITAPDDVPIPDAMTPA